MPIHRPSRIQPAARRLVAGAATLVLVACTASDPGAGRPTEKRVALPTGVTLSYVEAGRPGSPVVVLIHGFPDSWQVYEAAIPVLAERHRVLALDLRGHGDSDKPERGYAQADFVADLAAFLDETGTARASIVGHSLGSFIAHKFAVEHPDRVERLVLVGSAPACDTPACEELRDLALGVGDPVDPQVVRDFQRSSFHLPPPEDLFERLMAQSLRVPGRVWRLAIPSLVEEDHRDRLGRITAPTLVLGGDRDGMYPAAIQEELRASIPGARLVMYEEVGHFPQLELPERFARDLATFLGAGR